MSVHSLTFVAGCETELRTDPPRGSAAAGAENGGAEKAGFEPTGWGTDHPYGEGSHAPLDDPATAPDGYPVKGNADSMKYHEPDGQWYEQTVAEVWFASAEAAEAAGFTKAGA